MTEIVRMDEQEEKTDMELDTQARRSRDVSDEQLQQIRESLRGLQFGAVQIIVQDGVIVQIDRTEKRRLNRSR